MRHLMFFTQKKFVNGSTNTQRKITMEKRILSTFISAIAVLFLTIVPMAAALAATSVTVTITVIDSYASPISGATARWNTGSWHNVSGSTDVNGQLTFDVTEPYNSIVVSYHQTKASMTQAQVNAVGNLPTFHTVDARIRLLDCNGDGLAGGVTAQGQGSWIDIGTTGADGYLTSPWQVFAGGPYQYRMNLKGLASNHNNSSQIKMMSVDGATDNVFQTGSMDFGSQTAHWAHGTHQYFTGLVQLMPGSYHMDIDGAGFDFTITAGNCQSGRLLTLLDHNGDGLAGGMAKAACGGSWASTQGPTDANGHMFYSESCGISKIRMTYNQRSEQQTTAQMADTGATWQTVEAVVSLSDHDGNGLPGGRVDQGGGFWDFHGITDANGELALEFFPDQTVKIKMSINSGRSEWHWFTPGPIGFQTGLVTSSTCSHYAAGSWRAIPGAGIELLPGIYKFKSPTTYAPVAAGTTNDNDIMCPAAP